MRATLTLILCLLLNIVQGQPSGKQMIYAGSIYDSQIENFLPNRAILILGNQIASIKPIAEVTAKEKSEYVLIDLSSLTVLPGLIDAHTHMLHTEGVGNGANFDIVKEILVENLAYRAIAASVKAKAYLQAGITTVQDLGNSGQFGDIALKSAIENGIVEGPRMSCSGPALAAFGGQFPGMNMKYQNIVNEEYRIVKGVDDATQAVRENVNQGADVIKIYATNSPNKTALSLHEIKAITTEAHRYGIRVTAHATDDISVNTAIDGGVDAIEHGYELSDSTLVKMAKAHIILVPTDGDTETLSQWAKLAYPEDSLNIPKNVQSFRRPFVERLKRAKQKGVVIAMGSDDYHDLKLPGAVPAKRVLLGYSEAGLTLKEVIKTGTVNGAIQLNMPTTIGQLKPGYLADIIAVSKGIQTDVKALMDVKFVMKDGKTYKRP
jgi:imidazolonepropionase-like amidohydrolase